jgi:hypothetical protein
MTTDLFKREAGQISSHDLRQSDGKGRLRALEGGRRSVLASDSFAPVIRQELKFYSKVGRYRQLRSPRISGKLRWKHKR